MAHYPVAGTHHYAEFAVPKLPQLTDGKATYYIYYNIDWQAAGPPDPGPPEAEAAPPVAAAMCAARAASAQSNKAAAWQSERQQRGRCRATNFRARERCEVNGRLFDGVTRRQGHRR